MSHSGRLALYAFSDAGAVGVDVEVARRPIDELAIAARTLGATEAQRLEALDPASAPAGVPARVGPTRGRAEVPGRGHRRCARGPGADGGCGWPSSRSAPRGGGGRR